jgi:CRP-like cAMP-binding protein
MPLPKRNSTKNRLLAALPQEELERFFSELHSFSYPQRHVFYEAGAPIEHVYFIEEGVSSVLTTMSNGSTIEVGMVGFEGMVGVPILLGGTISAQHIVMQIPGTVLQMSAPLCKTAFNQSEAVRRVTLRFTDAMLNQSAQTAACNRLHSIEQRCARWLLMSSDRTASSLLPLTQEFLSSMLGVRRAGVTETAGELQRSGLIRYHHGVITIVDREGLEATACECYRIDRARFDRLL